MAMSVNGMIAAQDGNEDFLSHEHWKTFGSLVKEFGNFIVGSRTYEAVNSWNENYGFDDFQDVKKIIVSDNSSYELKDGYDLALSPRDAISVLEKAGFEKALVSGGSVLNTSFASENVIDEVILNVEPAVLAKGVPLFQPSEFQLQMELVDSQKLDDGIVQLHYRVVK